LRQKTTLENLERGRKGKTAKGMKVGRSQSGKGQ